MRLERLITRKLAALGFFPRADGWRGPTETRFIGKHDPQPTTAPGRRPPSPLYRAWEAVFLKSFWAARLRWG